MNDEIKEILDYWQFYINEPNNYKLLNVHFDEIKKVLDYITNLQEEKEDYKSRCENAVEFTKKESKKCYSNRITDNPTKVIGNFMWHTDKLLNILNGGDKE